MKRKPDPPVRADGRCALKSCRKFRKITKQSRRYAGVQIDLDPFCSSECCRAFHGCRLTNINAGKSQGGRTAQAQRRALAGWDSPYDELVELEAATA